ncbi:unnamed protein product [Mytilus edulis]|uniref:Uncharacterized protein n=1 Tax=Mytilus edulis TaxID=6550 RepID=A0A8S3UFA0_MYTED|nr:unnamed protein product [Mytilus edulis]
MKDSDCMTSNHIFMGLIKMLKRDGKDVAVHKRAILERDIQKLYLSGVFRVDDPIPLKTKISWDIVLNFGRRRQEGLYFLTRTGYAKFKIDKDHKYYKMTYYESMKTHHGIDSRKIPKSNACIQIMKLQQSVLWQVLTYILVNSATNVTPCSINLNNTPRQTCGMLYNQSGK